MREVKGLARAATGRRTRRAEEASIFGRSVDGRKESVGWEGREREGERRKEAVGRERAEVVCCSNQQSLTQDQPSSSSPRETPLARAGNSFTEEPRSFFGCQKSRFEGRMALEEGTRKGEGGARWEERWDDLALVFFLVSALSLHLRKMRRRCQTLYVSWKLFHVTENLRSHRRTSLEDREKRV